MLVVCVACPAVFLGLWTWRTVVIPDEDSLGCWVRLL